MIPLEKIMMIKNSLFIGPYVKRRLPVLETNWDEYKQVKLATAPSFTKNI